MRNTLLLSPILLALVTGCGPGTSLESESLSTAATHKTPEPSPTGYTFAAPVRLEAAGEVIKVDEPGFACPTMADVDGDGAEDLVVGQFAGGAMQIFRNIASAGQTPQFAAGEWIQVAGEKATVPGVMKGWHTFGLLWLPDEYVFYIDGKETWRSKAGGVCQVPQYLLHYEDVLCWF